MMAVLLSLGRDVLGYGALTATLLMLADRVSIRCGWGLAVGFTLMVATAIESLRAPVPTLQPDITHVLVAGISALAVVRIVAYVLGMRRGRLSRTI